MRTISRSLSSEQTIGTRVPTLGRLAARHGRDGDGGQTIGTRVPTLGPRVAAARIALAAALAAIVAGCASSPPRQQADICEVFEQHPDWYDYARASAAKWGTPVHVQMAFVRHESSYRARAKPPFEWFLIIPLGRASSAKGYAQAQDPVWGEYQAERGRLFRSRSDMEDALDFIGWYNYKTWRELDIPRTDAYRLYLAYHEGRGGYRRGTWKKKPGVQRTAKRVRETARAYQSQLARCERRFRCDSWYQIWPFCG